MGKSSQLNKLPTIYILALAALGGGLSGGDRVFIELARNLSKKNPVVVYVWEEGWLMCQREKLTGSNLQIKIVKVGSIAKLGFIITYLYRIFLGLKLGLTLQIKDKNLIYSASEFWMDSFPAVLLKLRNPKIRWMVAWLQTAPSPLKGFTEGKRKEIYRLETFLYWFMQQPVKPLITRFANYVLVNNETEKKQFPKLIKQNRVLVAGAGVNTEAILTYLKTHKFPKIKKYLAVFQGRFHPQKGVVELIDIWQLVIQEMPNAKLAMIGDGPLMEAVKKRIKELYLQDNIELFGYLHDGDKKYSIFQRSYIVVHPAFYDSGGMAAAEAMAFGLPCIGFNLKSYLSYFPKGMVKVSIGDLQKFSEAIIQLFYNESLYNRLSKQAREMILDNYCWDIKIKKLWDFLGVKK